MRELTRRPGRFVAATAALTALAVLLMFLGSLLDGLIGSATGAYRAQRGDVIVYSVDAGDSLVRSRIDPAVRGEIEAVPGVGATGGIGSVQLGARPAAEPDRRELIATAVIGYELAPTGLPDEPPAPGQAIADDSILDDGVQQGDTVLLGPARTPVEIVGFVSDTQYSGQATLWTSLDTWRQVAAENRPAQAFDDGGVQALVVEVDDPEATGAAIDVATAQATETLALADAIDALPGVSQQRSTFNRIIGATVAVAMVVVALFFTLLTVERTGLYGVLKAIGASSGALFVGVAAQAAVLAIVSSVLGAAATLAAAAAIPPGSLPFQAGGGRLLTSAGLMLAAAVLGSAFSLRRVLRIEPAAAIGVAS